MPINVEKIRKEINFTTRSKYCTMIMKHYFNYDLANDREISIMRLNDEVPYTCILEFYDIISDANDESF